MCKKVILISQVANYLQSRFLQIVQFCFAWSQYNYISLVQSVPPVLANINVRRILSKSPFQLINQRLNQFISFFPYHWTWTGWWRLLALAFSKQTEFCCCLYFLLWGFLTAHESLFYNHNILSLSFVFFHIFHIFDLFSLKRKFDHLSIRRR